LLNACVIEAAMDHIGGLVSSDVAKEFIELWQVSKL